MRSLGLKCVPQLRRERIEAAGQQPRSPNSQSQALPSWASLRGHPKEPALGVQGSEARGGEEPRHRQQLWGLQGLWKDVRRAGPVSTPETHRDTPQPLHRPQHTLSLRALRLVPWLYKTLLLKKTEARAEKQRALDEARLSLQRSPGRKHRGPDGLLIKIGSARRTLTGRDRLWEFRVGQGKIKSGFSAAFT